MCWRGTLTHFQFLLKNVTPFNPPWSLNLPNELYSRAENYTYWISCHILYIKSFLKSPGQEISEYIVFNSSWEFHFAKFRFQAVVLLKKKSERRYVTYYSLLFLPHEIIPKDLSRSSTSLPWVRIFGLRIKAIREKMPPKLLEISSPVCLVSLPPLPTLDILFSSNHNIHKSSWGLCFLSFRPFNWKILLKSID